MVQSVLYYGAPIWADHLNYNSVIVKEVKSLLRTLAIRVICGYRTISYVGATLLAGIYPFEIRAERLASLYWRERENRSMANPLPLRVRKEMREEANARAMESWSLLLNDRRQTGTRIREALAPIIGAWLDRVHGSLTFRITQLLSEHGCFNEFLARINRAPSPLCVHCSDEVQDNADHTLLDCTAWRWKRYNLYEVLGFELGDIDPPDLRKIVETALRGQAEWAELRNFAEEVMSTKEQAERDRQGIG